MSSGGGTLSRGATGGGGGAGGGSSSKASANGSSGADGVLSVTPDSPADSEGGRAAGRLTRAKAAAMPGAMRTRPVRANPDAISILEPPCMPRARHPSHVGFFTLRPR